MPQRNKQPQYPVLDCPYPVVLGSASPRRRELARQLFADFTCGSIDLDESQWVVPDPVTTATQTALAKARRIFDQHNNCLVLGGDTVVALSFGAAWSQLAKPTDAEDARKMLRELAGRTHVVFTGIAFVWPTGEHTFCDSSRVTFRELSEEEIAEYVATGEPMDKAGSYGLQGGARGFVSKIEGYESTVIGLPVERIVLEWRKVFEQ